MKKRIIYLIISTILISCWAVYYSTTSKTTVAPETSGATVVSEKEEIVTAEQSEETVEEADSTDNVNITLQKEENIENDKDSDKPKTNAVSKTDNKNKDSKTSEKKDNDKTTTKTKKEDNNKNQDSKQDKTPAKTTSDKKDSSTQKSTDKEKSEPKKQKKSTLLIYMIGSDLESRSGAGTEDMEELKNSGIDLEKNKVVIFAGGSPRWHNDITSEEKINILELTKNGFKNVAQMNAASMGTADSLAEFLNYGYKNYSADSYGLIMWDHGNGPNIGYGKDMLFDNDSLTLAEMKAALSKSPFNSGNKLEWVGFDACLMSTAELVCVWDDYAKYLVASQEIEPSFGWNYDIFKTYSSANTKSFLVGLTENYLSTCLSYYNKKGQSNKDITLACMDLTYGKELESSINALFEKAGADIGTKYDTLVRQRVATRALGRASTGSEYDLVDLGDLATQLRGIYPEETKKLSDTLNKMIVNNETNAQLCCGLSFYYPFYNKFHFEKGWEEAYRNIGIFESYRKYLEKYKTTWLKETNLQQYEKSPTPQKTADAGRNGGIAGTYKLPLSPEQAANYAEAKVYVLEKFDDKKELYQNIITSGNVKNDDGVLYANISGKAIYAKDNYGNKTIPVTEVNDTVGDISRFTCRTTAVTLNDHSHSMDFKDIGVFDIQLALNNATEEVSVVSVFPYNPPTRANEISSGKLEDVDLDAWDEYWFPRLSYKYVVRNEQGIVLPMDKWAYAGSFSSEILPKKNGLNFVYEQMDDRTYYVMFEITDTQGGKYCSELLEVEKEEIDDINKPAPEDIVTNWNDGTEVEIYNGENISLKLKLEFDYVGKPKFILVGQNNNNYPVSVNIDDLCINGEYAYPLNAYISIPANSSFTDTSSLLNFSSYLEPAVAFGAVEKINRIDGTLLITNKDTLRDIVKNQKLVINCSENTNFKELSEYVDSEYSSKSFRGAFAEKQLLYQDESTKITLLSFGEQIYVLLENLSDKPQSIGCNGIMANGKTIKFLGAANNLPGNTMSVQRVSLSYLPDQKIGQIENLSLRFSSENPKEPLFDTPDGGKWLPLILKELGKDTVQSADGEVIYSNDILKVTLNEFSMEKQTSGKVYPTWYTFVENTSDTDISLYLTSADNSDARMSVSADKIAAHSGAFVTFEWNGEFEIPADDTLPMPEAQFNMHIMDFDQCKILLPCSEPITFYGKRAEDKTTYVEASLESVKITETEDFVLWIEKAENDNKQSAYSFKLENKVSEKISVDLKKIHINESISTNKDIRIYCDGGQQSSTFLDSELSLYTMNAIDAIDSISGELTVKKGSYSQEITLLDKQPIKITFVDDGKLDMASSGYKKATVVPYADVLAEKQILVENDKIRITLMHFGKNDITNGHAYLCYENLSSDVQKIRTEAMSLCSVTKSVQNEVVLEPEEKTFREYTFGGTWLEENGIQSADEVKFFFRTKSANESEYTHIAPTALLKEKGTPTPHIPEGKTLFDKNGVKIVLNNFSYNISYTGEMLPVWDISVINDTDSNIDISDIAYTKGGEYTAFSSDLKFSSSLVAAHQRVNCKLTSSNLFHDPDMADDELILRIILKDWDGNRIFVDSETTTFPMEEEELVLTPFMDASAEEQVLWETEEFRLKLLCFGGNNKVPENLLFSLENFSNHTIIIDVRNIAVNSVMLPFTVDLKADANKTSYASTSLEEDTLHRQNINSIESMEIGVAVYEESRYKPTESHWTTVELKEQGKAPEFTPGDNVIFDKEGVRIILDGFEYLSDGREAWKVTVINDTDKVIQLGDMSLSDVIHRDALLNDIVWLSNVSQLGPHKRIHGKIHYNKRQKHDTLEFRVTIRDLFGNIIYQDDELITLYAGDGKKFTKTKIQ